MLSVISFAVIKNASSQSGNPLTKTTGLITGSMVKENGAYWKGVKKVAENRMREVKTQILEEVHQYQ